MKKILLSTILLMATVQITFAQNTIAKLKYEDAEEAFLNEEYQITLDKLDESEKLFGKTNPPMMYLRIMAQKKLISYNPYGNFELLQSLRKNCEFYLTKYANLTDIEDKFKEVYRISEYIKDFSSNKNYFTAREYYNAEDFDNAKIFCDKAVLEGDAAAMAMIGDFNYFSLGVLQNYAEAMNWYQKAANKGNTAAILMIGNMYYQGDGVTQNYSEAMNWFLKASNKGNAVAKHLIGKMYGNGVGVQQDLKTAQEWKDKAASAGYKE